MLIACVSNKKTILTFTNNHFTNNKFTGANSPANFLIYIFLNICTIIHIKVKNVLKSILSQ